MFFFDLLVFSKLINNPYLEFIQFSKFNGRNIFIEKKLKISNDSFDNNKIGIIDFRFILKKSNAMKLLGNKFLSLEKEINEKIKKKQQYLNNKEENIKKNKNNLSELEYKNKLKLFKNEVFKTQKKYKKERVLLNKSFQKIQKDIKDLLAQIIKDVSIKKNINIVLLKENVFLFNDTNSDFTLEVLKLFNDKTKSMKIIITSPE